MMGYIMGLVGYTYMYSVHSNMMECNVEHVGTTTNLEDAFCWKIKSGASVKQ